MYLCNEKMRAVRLIELSATTHDSKRLASSEVLRHSYFAVQRLWRTSLYSFTVWVMSSTSFEVDAGQLAIASSAHVLGPSHLVRLLYDDLALGDKLGDGGFLLFHVLDWAVASLSRALSRPSKLAKLVLVLELVQLERQGLELGTEVIA